MFLEIYTLSKKKLGKISEIKENYGQPMIQFQSVELHRPVGGSVPPRQATDNGEWRWSILNCNWLLINTVLLGCWTGGKGCNLILAPGIFFFFFFFSVYFHFWAVGKLAMLLVSVFPGHQMIGLKRKTSSLEKHLWRQPSDAGRKTRGSTLKRLFYHESECLSFPRYFLGTNIDRFQLSRLSIIRTNESEMQSLWPAKCALN